VALAILDLIDSQDLQADAVRVGTVLDGLRALAEHHPSR
jgi:4-aminobutyrate aminotransferase-like enzyme